MIDVVLLRRHAVGAFFASAFTLSWVGAWLGLGPAYLRGETIDLEGLLFPGLLMVAGPCLAAVALTLGLDGRSGLRELWHRTIRWRVGGRWYLPPLIFPVLILATLLPLSVLQFSELAPTFFAPGILMGLLAGFVEEIGWTGFATPRMHRRYGPLVASLLLGFLHALWHAAPDFLGNSREFGRDWLPYFAGFFLFVVALRVLMGWVYANTGSVLLGQLMHASSTGFLAVLVPIDIGGSPWASFYPLYAVVLWGSVVAVVALYGERLVRHSNSSPERA